MNYPIVIHRDEDSDYGVTVPDLPGCFSAGSTVDEALAMAREAIELHLEGLIEDGQVVPEPGRIEDHQANPDYAGGTWAVVSIVPSRLRVKAKRVNISMPERVLDAVDRFADAAGETRSGLLVKAALTYIDEHTSLDEPTEKANAGSRRQRKRASSGRHR
jgi:predicted RNase H-like HicB family nuclease